MPIITIITNQSYGGLSGGFKIAQPTGSSSKIVSEPELQTSICLDSRNAFTVARIEESPHTNLTEVSMIPHAT
jgi:hypothetical protein